MKFPRTRLSVELLETRCTPTTFGNPWPDASHLTLSFAPDGTQVGSHTSNLFQTLNAIAPTKTWQMEIMRAFQTWAVNANINLTVVPDSGLPFGTPGTIQGDARFGDIRLAAFAMPPDAEAGAAPFEMDAGTWAGDVRLNSAASFGVSGNGQYDLYSVMLHEAGHVFGLDHSVSSASPMYENYLGVRSGLSAIDVTNLQAVYGARAADAFEGTTGNEQFSTATRLNSFINLGGIQSITANADITTLQDRDVYSFNTLLNFGGVDVTLRTAGNSLLTPRVTVFDAAGRTVISTVATDPLQGGFVIHLANVKPLSTYYVKVESGQQGVFGVGSYALTVSELPLLNNLFGAVTGTVSFGLNAITTMLINNDLHTNDSFTTATSLTPVFAPANTSYYDTYRASISDSSDVDFYKLQAPVSAPGSTENVLTAMVWGLQNQLNPRVNVFDAQHNLLASDVVVNQDLTYTVQIAHATPGATYYVEVLAARSGGVQSVGNYFVGVEFSPHGATLNDYVSGTLTDSRRVALNALQVDEPQLFHFVLSATNTGSSAAASVQMTLTNAAGQVVFTLVADSEATVSGNIALYAGAYTLRITGTANNNGALPTLTYRLRGDNLTDPIGPESADPTGDPGGAPNPGGSPQYTWTGGSSTGVPPQDPSSNPYNPGNQPTVSLYNPGDQTYRGGDGVYLPLSATDPSGAPLTFSATGLPAGLSIDPSTGVISGVIANDAASASPYVVTVTATDPGANASAAQTFYWAVDPPVVTLSNPGDQTNYAGDAIWLQLAASNSDGYPLTYQVTGLPPGLSIDPNTGVISGTIAPEANTTEPSVVTITVWDPSSNVSVSVTFDWTVNGF